MSVGGGRAWGLGAGCAASPLLPVACASNEILRQVEMIDSVSLKAFPIYSLKIFIY